MISDKTEGGRLETIFLALEDAAIMIHELRAERDAACLREPTQAEGDAHECRNDQGMGASYGAGESFVPMGSHHGWRCRCGTWVWGGPTVCQRCVDAAAVKIAVEWKAEADRLRKLFDDAGQGEARICLVAVNAELQRRKRGPLTLAEAVASGRPFRRKAWGAAYWWDGITSSEIDGYDVPMFTKDGDIDLVLACEDLFATDYEIRPEEDQQ